MAAVDYFLKIDGISGESTDAQHKGEIEVESFSWGVKNTTLTRAGGGGAGRAQFQDLAFTSRVSKASPSLFLKCASGAHIKQAVLTARKAGEQPVEFLKVTLSDVLVSSYSVTAIPPGPQGFGTLPVDAVFVAPDATIVGPDAPVDDLALSYSSVRFTEGPVQHISVEPTASGQLAFDTKTGLVTFYPPDPGAPALMTVGMVNGSIQRGVQEFDITTLVGLLTAPFSTAHLRLGVTEIRQIVNPGPPGILSVTANSETDAPRPHRFDVILYTPADGTIDASDLTRPGKRIGTITVDPNADPASLDLDLTSLVAQRDLDTLGIRIQLRGLDLPDGSDEREDVHTDDDSEDDRPKLPFSAAFSLDLALDTQ